MIVITTPTGQIGQQVLERIVDSGKPIRVIARDPSRLPQRVRDRVEVFQGSHDDMDVVSKAFAGAESVLWLVPPNPQSGNSTEYYLNFTRPACQAIQSLGVKRVVGVSSLGRGFDRHAGILTAAFEMDALIESTGVSYRSLRCRTLWKICFMIWNPSKATERSICLWLEIRCSRSAQPGISPRQQQHSCSMNPGAVKTVSRSSAPIL